MPSFLERPSELDGDALIENRQTAWRYDQQFRDRYVDFEANLALYESGTDDATDEDGLPRINLIKRAINDTVSFVVPNLPKAILRADKTLPPGIDMLERELRFEAIETSEKTANDIISTTLMDSQYNDILERAAKDIGTFGVGYLFTEIDTSADVRHSFELRSLIKKLERGEQWTEEDAIKYVQLSMKMRVRHIDSRNIFWQAGITTVGEQMLRVHITEKAETRALREKYKDVDGAENIQPGRLPYYIEVDRQAEHNTTGVLTTYEVEPFASQMNLPGSDTVIKFLDSRMVKTVIAGGVLVEHKMWNSTEGPVRLPVVPFYFEESKYHPYGRSMARDMAQSEKLINRVRALMYRAGLNSARPNGQTFFIKNLGPEDREELSRSFRTGEPAYITGNMAGGEVHDIRQMVMSNSQFASQLDPSLRQIMEIEMEAFRTGSTISDSEAVSRARTGSAKRAQISFDDRPKALNIMTLSKSVEDLYDNLYEIIQVFYNDEIPISVNRPNDGRRQVTLNTDFDRELPVMNDDGTPVVDESQVSPENPNGIVMRPVHIKVNDMSLPMKAEAEGRGNIPFDPIARYQLFRSYMADTLVIPETARDYILDDEIKMRDDINRRKAAEQQARALQEAAEAQQLMGHMGEGMGSAEDFAQGNLAQDLNADIPEQA